MKKRIGLTLFMVFYALCNVSSYAQHQVSGVVTGSDGESLPGVSIVVDGTTIGVVSNMDGHYQINVPDDQAVLVFTFVGKEEQVIPVDGRSIINVTMVPTAIDLDEVVVTALGITRQQKSLGYSVTQVSGEDLQRVTQENFLYALSGQVPGVSIRSTGPAGSSIDMVIRGESSLTSDNQPLYVIDGVPLHNTLNNVTEIGQQNRVDYGSAISDINPNDIKSITILKGPSASALYGSRAGNGVVVITTRKGDEREGFNVEINSSTSFDFPYKYLDKHRLFANGGRPFDNENFPSNAFGVPIIDERSSGWKGPQLDKGITAIQWPFSSEEMESGIPVPRELVSYDNPPNFFQTAITSTNSISISNSSDLFSYRFSYANMANRGLVPNSDLGRNSISTNALMNLTDNITLSSSVNYVKSKSDHRPGGDRGTNPMHALYEINPHINILDMRDYWEDGREGFQQKNPYTWGDPNRRSIDNPWFLAYEVSNSFVRDRFYGNLAAEWRIVPNFSINATYAHDEYIEQRETRLPLSNVVAREPNGGFGLVDMKRLERNTDLRFSYDNNFNAISLLLSAGGNVMYQRGDNNYAHTKARGSGLITPGVYTLDNIAPDNLEFGSNWYQKAIYSIYGLASIGYQDIVYLDITGRNDWSSTLPVENRSYFYPSASLSLLVNNMFNLPSNINLVKLRGGYAQVGNDTDPYRLYPVLNQESAWGSALQMSVPGRLLTPDLMPEQKTSYEVGSDIALFGNRLTMNFTVYREENENQILPVEISPSTGYTRRLINAGLLESRGWEASIGGVPVSTNEWQWWVNFNFSRDRVTLKELAPGMDYLELWSTAGAGAISWIGEEIGQLVDNNYLRVDDPNSEYYGWPILNNQGFGYEDRTLQDAEGNRIRPVIGNYNHDLLGGVQSRLSYRNFSLNMSVDYRIGGKFLSETFRFHGGSFHFNYWIDKMHNLSHIEDLPAYLKANSDKYLLPDGEFFVIVGGPTKELGGFPVTVGGITLYDGAFQPGVIPQYDADGNFIGYFENLGGEGTRFQASHFLERNHGERLFRNYAFDADYIKLREVSLTYNIPQQLMGRMGIGGASLTLFSRNIILWTKAKIGIDPETAYQPGFTSIGGIPFQKGVERFNVSPWTIPLGIRLNVNF